MKYFERKSSRQKTRKKNLLAKLVKNKVNLLSKFFVRKFFFTSTWVEGKTFTLTIPIFSLYRDTRYHSFQFMNIFECHIVHIIKLLLVIKLTYVLLGFFIFKLQIRKNLHIKYSKRFSEY